MSRITVRQDGVTLRYAPEAAWRRVRAGGVVQPANEAERRAWEAYVSEHPLPERAAALDPWPLKTPPADYLERHPDGPNAKLARAHLAREED